MPSDHAFSTDLFLEWREKERQEEMLRQDAMLEKSGPDEDLIAAQTDDSGNITYVDTYIRLFWERTSQAVEEIEKQRAEKEAAAKVRAPPR